MGYVSIEVCPVLQPTAHRDSAPLLPRLHARLLVRWFVEVTRRRLGGSINIFMTELGQRNLLQAFHPVLRRYHLRNTLTTDRLLRELRYRRHVLFHRVRSGFLGRVVDARQLVNHDANRVVPSIHKYRLPVQIGQLKSEAGEARRIYSECAPVREVIWSERQCRRDLFVRL